jgi:hypothetical protein
VNDYVAEGRKTFERYAILAKKNISRILAERPVYDGVGVKIGDDLTGFPLAYGITNHGGLRKFVDLLYEMHKHEGITAVLEIVDDVNFGLPQEAATVITLHQAARMGRKIFFNLDGIQEVDEILADQGRWRSNITALELRYIRDNWDEFWRNISFWKNNKQVTPPWETIRFDKLEVGKIYLVQRPPGYDVPLPDGFNFFKVVKKGTDPESITFQAFYIRTHGDGNYPASCYREETTTDSAVWEQWQRKVDLPARWWESEARVARGGTRLEEIETGSLYFQMSGVPERGESYWDFLKVVERKEQSIQAEIVSVPLSGGHLFDRRSATFSDPEQIRWLRPISEFEHQEWVEGILKRWSSP